MQSPFLASRRFPRAKFTRTRHLNYQAAFQFLRLHREKEIEKEEEESPAAITRGESCHGEKNETPFASLSSVVIFPPLFLPCLRPIITIDIAKEEDGRADGEGRRARDTRTGSVSPREACGSVCDVTRTLSPSHTNLHKSISTSAQASVPVRCPIST